MKVPILNPVKGNKIFQDELEEAALNVLRSGQFILGKEVEAFEEECASYLKVKHAIGVSSGTDALLLALMSLDIGPGDEVICPSFTFFATAGSIARVGAKPVFADVETHTFNIDADSVRSLITDRTKAIIPVHLYGQSANMTLINEIAQEHNLFVIEDCAQAIGAKHIIDMVGSIGDIGCFSFFPSKNLGGFGDAGLVTTNQDILATRLRELRVHGSHIRYEHNKIGGNFRIDALQAALLRIKLRYLPTFESGRQDNANIYYDRLSLDCVLPAKEEENHTFNQFTILVENRDELHKYLASHGISTGIYYPIPLHKQVCFQDIVPENTYLPVSEFLCKHCLSLPVAYEITEDQVIYVAEKINHFFKK